MGGPGGGEEGIPISGGAPRPEGGGEEDGAGVPGPGTLWEVQKKRPPRAAPAPRGGGGAGGLKNARQRDEEERSGCLNGSVGQCDSLGRAYATGIGLLQDASRARFYSEKACQGGSPAACTRVGMEMPQAKRDALARRRTGSLLVLGAIVAVILGTACGIAILAYRRIRRAGAESAVREPARRPVAVAPLSGAVRPTPRRS